MVGTTYSFHLDPFRSRWYVDYSPVFHSAIICFTQICSFANPTTVVVGLLSNVLFIAGAVATTGAADVTDRAAAGGAFIPGLTAAAIAFDEDIIVIVLAIPFAAKDTVDE